MKYIKNVKLINVESGKKYEYDDKGNIIYIEFSDGSWTKTEYDENGNITYEKHSNGQWLKRTIENNNIIFLEWNDGGWIKKIYNQYHQCIHIEHNNGDIEYPEGIESYKQYKRRNKLKRVLINE